MATMSIIFIISRPKTLFDGHDANLTATSNENQIIQKVSISQNGLSVSAERWQTRVVLVMLGKEALIIEFDPFKLIRFMPSSMVPLMGIDWFFISHLSGFILCWKSGSVSRQKDTIESKITDTLITAITRAHKDDSGYSNKSHNWRCKRRSGKG